MDDLDLVSYTISPLAYPWDRSAETYKYRSNELVSLTSLAKVIEKLMLVFLMKHLLVVSG